MKQLKAIIIIITITTLNLGITYGQKNKTVSFKEYNKVLEQLQNFQNEKEAIEKNLKTFDELDYDIFSHEKWDRLGESHAENVIVNWPDGHRTFGIKKHIEDLKRLFVFAPDTRIKTHPMRIGSGNYTAVMGIMKGTFTKPMPIGNGKYIQPTGKSFSIPMATIGRWENGVMVEEYLFWDNKAYYDQLGL